MKRLAVLVPALVLGWWCHAADPVQIPVENGGFENGLDGWSTRGGEGSAVVPEAAHEGRGGLRIPAIEKTSVQAAPVPVDYGKKYRISCWVRGIGSIPVALGLGFRNDSGKYVDPENPNVYKLNLPPGAEWQHFSREFVPPDGAASLIVGISTWVPPGKAGTSPVDVDDVALEEIGDAN